jgi:hypothetical protein
MQWTTAAGLAYWWLSIALVQNDFQAHPISRPAYARSGGPHVLLVLIYLPLGHLFSPGIGGSGRFTKMLVHSMVHLGLVVASFWGLGFFIENPAIRFSIIAGLLSLMSLLFLLPIRN